MSGPRRLAFTLMELLVVVGIIGLLVGILLPSMKAARNSAKNAKVRLQVKSLEEGLQMFHGDNGDYPDSSKRKDPTEYADSGEDPQGREVEHEGDATILYGAQMLARAMVGKDFKGYVSPKEARRFDPTLAPTEWYDVPSDDYESQFPRKDVYFSERNVFWRTAADVAVTLDRTLPGIRPDSIGINNDQLIIVDVFDRPVLYYKANPRGNVLCDGEVGPDGIRAKYDPENLPYYNILDNDVFTGALDTINNTDVSGEPGWRFTSGGETHPIGELGDPVEPDDPANIPPGYRTTFARYIHDHKTEGASAGEIKPFNPESYLLISAGIDGWFGTEDDITNFDTGRKE